MATRRPRTAREATRRNVASKQAREGARAILARRGNRGTSEVLRGFAAASGISAREILRSGGASTDRG
jgi:hypothetical protein